MDQNILSQNRKDNILDAKNRKIGNMTRKKRRTANKIARKTRQKHRWYIFLFEIHVKRGKTQEPI